MISRIWHGWTTHENAQNYECLLKDEIFLGIQDQQFCGFKGIKLHRRGVGDEVEFITITEYESLDAVREFAGDEYESAVVPEAARAVLSHFDERSQHYEIREEINRLGIKSQNEISYKFYNQFFVLHNLDLDFFLMGVKKPAHDLSITLPLISQPLNYH